jgi:hypothetical protein
MVGPCIPGLARGLHMRPVMRAQGIIPQGNSVLKKKISMAL